MEMGDEEQDGSDGANTGGIRREKQLGGGWSRIIFISLAQRRTGTNGLKSGERERRYRRKRQGNGGNSQNSEISLVGSPGLRASAPLLAQLLGGCPGSTRAGTAKSPRQRGRGSARHLLQRDTHACRGMRRMDGPSTMASRPDCGKGNRSWKCASTFRERKPVSTQYVPPYFVHSIRPGGPGPPVAGLGNARWIAKDRRLPRRPKTRPDL
jgi:hypothetical protein